MADGRAFAGMVIPHRHENATLGGRARHIGVAHHITRSVDPRPLAIPQAKDAIELTLAAQLGLLGAPKGGGGEIFVETGFKADIGGLQILLRLLHLLIDRTQRRAAIARHIASGNQPRRTIPRFLHQHQAHQRLGSIQEDGSLPEIITVVQTDGAMAHDDTPPKARLIIGHNI